MIVLMCTLADSFWRWCLFQCEDDIYILFNPWCREDPVYMEGDSQRREYVLNETGKIWVGSYKQPKGRRWIFGQFDDVVLPATMYLLEQSSLPHPDRGSPIQVVRAISSIVSLFENLFFHLHEYVVFDLKLLISRRKNPSLGWRKTRRHKPR